jgi:uncharacterized protein (TIGR02284 family)
MVHDCFPSGGFICMTNGQTIRTLNELLVMSRDGYKGFLICAEHVRGERLRELLQERARACAEAMEELQALVRSLGGEPAAECSTFGAMRRRWINIRTSFADGDDEFLDETIVAECERGEETALEAYRNALDDHLPDFVRYIVLQQFEGVMNNYDRIRFLESERRFRGCAAVAPPGSETTP